MAGISHPHLVDLDRKASENAERIREMFDTLSERQLTWKPDPKTWSIAEVVEHLRLIDETYMTKIEEALAAAPKKNGKDPYVPKGIAAWFIGLIGENGTKKVKTLSVFRPDQQGHAGDPGAGERFLAGQEKLRSLMAEADGRNLNEKIVTSPLFRLLRYSIGEGFTMLISHQRRHLSQIERLRNRPEFPA